MRKVDRECFQSYWIAITDESGRSVATPLNMTILDHALTRAMNKGVVAQLEVSG